MRKLKDSNDYLYGMIPAEWGMQRVKHCAVIHNGSDPIKEGDIPVYGSGQDIVKYCGEYKNGPAILIGRKGTLDRPKLIEGKFWNVDTAMDMYPKKGTNIKWLLYAATIFDIPRYSTETAKPSMTQTDYYNMQIPLISIEEQQDIVNYLDDKNKNVDEAIDRHNTIIEKLDEYKKTIIRNTVKEGLNHTVFKETDSLWFSKIPQNWNFERIKNIFSIKKRIAGREGYTVLSITQKGIIPKDISSNIGQLAQDYSGYQLVYKGDFAMNHMDLLTGWVDISAYDGVTSPDYRVFCLNDKENNNPKYFLYIMQMCYFDRLFYNLGAGVSELGRWRLQAGPFKNFKIPVPPLAEQNQIVEYLSSKCSKIDEAIARQQQVIEKLEEYRKSVIYSAVTGKIDCRKES